MRVLKTVASMQRLALLWRREGVRVALVPTMGYLHEGHVSLIHRARKAAGPKGRVVVSVYVNPTQFGPREDFSRYPRDLKRDCNLCRKVGADIVFAPGDGQMYPGEGEEIYSTFIVEEKLSQGMEGGSRPTHFRGVTTVVGKLFNIVLPDLAVFGEKDFQQAAVIRRMVRDLNFPVKIIVAPTFREADGLAMSSRNKYLTAEQRAQADVLWRCIKLARGSMREKTLSAAALRRRLARLVAECSEARLNYIEFLEPETLKAVRQVKRGTHMALAVFFGKTRLIDNGRL